VLVDDEDEVRGRIASNILAESGFEVVGTAGNGYDALELIEKHNPQVVLTDIKMPYIDGIELARIIRRDYPTVRIGFITGYDEFDYAREAIKLNVFTYLTKPLTQEDISGFLVKLKHDLDQEFEENYNRQEITKRYQQSVPLVIENYFVSLLASGASGSEDDIEQLKQYGVSLDESRYLVAFVVVERNPEKWGIIEFEKLKLSVRSRLSTLLNLEGFDFYCFMFHEGIVFVVKEKCSDFGKEIDIVLNRMARTTEYFLSVDIDIGVSLLHRDFSELCRAYEEAGSALSYSKFGAEGHVFYFSQIADRKAEPVNLKDGDARNLEQLLRYGSDAEIAKFFDDLKRQTAQDAAKAGNLNLYVLNLVGLLSNYAASIGIDINELTGGDIIDLMGKIRNLDQLFSWIAVLAKKIRERTSVLRANNAQRLLDQAVSFIQQNYSDPDLTIDDVCDSLGISASYLSQLFKKHKESTFVKFLTAVRMEKAMDRLVSSGDRIVEIAAACGYQDVYYFSHTFKKQVGMPPKKYREENT
jgi:Response regulator containing CheY-like receiver domain and AraC-type DNA-binding domain